MAKEILGANGERRIILDADTDLPRLKARLTKLELDILKLHIQDGKTIKKTAEILKIPVEQAEKAHKSCLDKAQRMTILGRPKQHHQDEIHRAAAREHLERFLRKRRGARRL